MSNVKKCHVMSCNLRFHVIWDCIWFEISCHLRFHAIWHFMSFEISCHLRFHVIWDFMSFEISYYLRFHVIWDFMTFHISWLLIFHDILCIFVFVFFFVFVCVFVFCLCICLWICICPTWPPLAPHCTTWLHLAHIELFRTVKCTCGWDWMDISQTTTTTRAPLAVLTRAPLAVLIRAPAVLITFNTRSWRTWRSSAFTIIRLFMNKGWGKGLDHPVDGPIKIDLMLQQILEKGTFSGTKFLIRR